MEHKILKVDSDLHKKLKMLSASSDKTILELTNLAIEKLIKEMEPEKWHT